MACRFSGRLVLTMSRVRPSKVARRGSCGKDLQVYPRAESGEQVQKASVQDGTRIFTDRKETAKDAQPYQEAISCRSRVPRTCQYVVPRYELRNSCSASMWPVFFNKSYRKHTAPPLF